MTRHNFSIVRSARLKVSHNLLAKAGTGLPDIKEVFSHEQAINQCSAFLSGLKGVKVTVCPTPPLPPAWSLSRSGGTWPPSPPASAERPTAWSCCAPMCRTGTTTIPASSVSPKSRRFYPGADRTSLMMTLPHKPGALYHVLSKFYALGINLQKLESRPLPDREFEFMFYFDLECSVYAPEMERLFRDLEEESEQCRYLGTYQEVIC